MRARIPILLFIAACNRSETARRAEPTSDGSSVNHHLVRVAPSAVCMVNDRYMGSPQIPVVVADKTYYGCCAMCKAKLETQESARTAIDPTSGKTVDKATAFIVSDDRNKVYYFENAANEARFSP